jgi:hypothetical protein
MCEPYYTRNGRETYKMSDAEAMKKGQETRRTMAQEDRRVRARGLHAATRQKQPEASARGQGYHAAHYNLLQKIRDEKCAASLPRNRGSGVLLLARMYRPQPRLTQRTCHSTEYRRRAPSDSCFWASFGMGWTMGCDPQRPNWMPWASGNSPE